MMIRVVTLCISVGMILPTSLVHCELEYTEEDFAYMEAVSNHILFAYQLHQRMISGFLRVLDSKNKNKYFEQKVLKTNVTVKDIENLNERLEGSFVCAEALFEEVNRVKTVQMMEGGLTLVGSLPNLISNEYAGWTSNVNKHMNASNTNAEGIIYGSTRGVVALSLPSLSETKISRDIVMHQVAFDWNSRKVYWINQFNNDRAESIKRANLDGTEVETVFQVESQAFAVDSITGNIYYQNSTSDDIRVCSRSGEKCSVLLTNQRNVSNIVVHLPRRLMFWIRDIYTVMKANMDGTNPEVVLFRRVHRFAVDEDAERLYWIGLDRKTVHSSDLNGDDESVHLNPAKFDRTAIAVYGNAMYVGRYMFHAAAAISKHTESPVIILEEICYIRHIVVYARERYLRSNPCANSPCSHLCVMKLESYACLCPEGQQLGRDGVTCV